MLLFCVEDPLRVGILRFNTGHPPVHTGKDLSSLGLFYKMRDRLETGDYMT